MVQYVLITTFRLCSICERGCCLFHCLYQPGKNVLQRKWEKTGGNVLQWKWEKKQVGMSYNENGKKTGGNVLQWKWEEKNRWECLLWKWTFRAGPGVLRGRAWHRREKLLFLGGIQVNTYSHSTQISSLGNQAGADARVQHGLLRGGGGALSQGPR